MALSNRGSLSHFIDPSVHSPDLKHELDTQFTEAKLEGTWAGYKTAMHFALLKIKKNVFKVSHDGAINIISYFFSDVISKMEDDEVKKILVDHLEELSSYCEEVSPTDSSWHSKVDSSLAPAVFIPGLVEAGSSSATRAFILRRILYQMDKRSATYILSKDGLLLAVIGVLKNELGSDVTLTNKILTALVKKQEGAEAIFEASSQDAFKNVCNANDSARFNVYDLMEKFCTLGSDYLSLVSNSGWLDDIFNNISCADPLRRVTTLQLLVDFIESGVAIDRLNSAGIFSKLENLVLQIVSEGNVDDSVLPGLMKVFAALANKRPELVLVKHAPIMKTLLSTMMETNDDIVFTICFETLVVMVMTVKGKQILASNYSAEFKRCLQKLVYKLRTPPVELRDRYLMVTAELFAQSIDKSNDRVESDELSNILQEWYLIMFPCKTLVVFEKLLKMPFNNLHMCTYHVLLSLLEYNWGVQLVCMSDGLLTLLMNRTTESTKEGKEMKYDVIKKLMSNDIVKDNASDKTIENLNLYLKRGALYVQPYVEDMDMMGFRR